jgi:gliding motility-associated protein GldM
LVGEKYQSQIFIAAYDSTQNPEVILDDKTSLPIQNGMGIFNGNTGSPGMKSYNGIVNLKFPSGEVKPYKFHGEYQVAVPSVSVSPTKMNVFYIGVDNPVDITAAGVAADKVNASISGGTISKASTGGYIVRVRTPGTVSISVTAEGKSLGKKDFRCKTVPDPVATLGSDKTNWKGGIIDKSTITALSGINATMENFDFELSFNITQFVVSATIEGFDEEYKSTSRAFTPQQKQLMKKVAKNKKVIIEQVKAMGPDGTSRKLNDLVFKLR